MPSSSTTSREAAKARVRAKIAARHNMTAREYLAALLHATHTNAESEAILDRFERETDTAARLSRVMDICDREQRNATRWENPIPVPEWVAVVQRAALGDDVRETGDLTVPRTERSYWQAIADALNAAHAAGMPVGIDLDGTLTDHNAWSVIWDRDAERWVLASCDAEDGAS